MDRVPDENAPLSTADALRRLAKGPDDRAWATVLNRHGVEILRATRRILGDPMSAEDACQETLLQVRDRAGQFRGRLDAPHAPDATARNWIMRIACNTALHMLRQRKRSKLREQNVARETPRVIDAPELSGGPQSDREELAAQVRAELAELPEKQRLPLTLHFFGGLDYEQLSSELRCGVGAARVRVHRALEKLRQRMAALGILVTTAAIYTLLHNSTASAAEAALDPERIARWQNLLFSSQHAAINVVSDPQFQLLGKLGYAVASAAICGTLAFSQSGKAPVKNETPAALPISKPVVQNVQPERAVPPAEAAMAHASEVRDMHQIGTTVQFVDTTDPFLKRIGIEFQGVEKPVPEVAKAPTPAPETREANLVSPLAQLEMLQAQQHSLNVRVARLHQEIEAHRAMGAMGVMDSVTLDDQNRLRRAADDQAELSNLIRQLADELRYSEPKVDSQAGLH
jgi:RNA polymerase sigma-70 factor (ECF subfamily)